MLFGGEKGAQEQVERRGQEQPQPRRSGERKDRPRRHTARRGADDEFEREYLSRYNTYSPGGNALVSPPARQRESGRRVRGRASGQQADAHYDGRRGEGGHGEPLDTQGDSEPTQHRRQHQRRGQHDRGHGGREQPQHPSRGADSPPVPVERSSQRSEFMEQARMMTHQTVEERRRFRSAERMAEEARRRSGRQQHELEWGVRQVVEQLRTERQKMRVALVVAYSGTNYRGVQKNCTEFDGEQPLMEGLNDPVEHRVEVALFKAKYILPTNFGDLWKIGWNRSTRTDSGVHSAGNVMSGKLLIPRECVDDFNQRLQDDVNKFLPDDIRVLGAFRTPGSFNARMDCSSRSYEYMFPMDVLPPDARGPDAAWRQCLDMFVGQHVFLNFCDRSKVLEKKTSTWLQQWRERSSFDAAEEYFEHCRETWPDNVPGQLRRIVESCSADTVVIGGKQFVRVSINGSSFMYHQIRKMMGFILGVADGIWDPKDMQLYLDSPFRLNVPLAPGEFLVHNFAMSAFWNWKSEQLFFNPDWDLLARLNDFKHNVIYPQLVISSEDVDMNSWREYYYENTRMDNQDMEVLRKQHLIFAKDVMERQEMRMQRRMHLEELEHAKQRELADRVEDTLNEEYRAEKERNLRRNVYLRPGPDNKRDR